MFTNMEAHYWAGWCSCKAADLCSRGKWFKSRAGYRLAWLRLYVLLSPGECWIMPWNQLRLFCSKSFTTNHSWLFYI